MLAGTWIGLHRGVAGTWIGLQRGVAGTRIGLHRGVAGTWIGLHRGVGRDVPVDEIVDIGVHAPAAHRCSDVDSIDLCWH